MKKTTGSALFILIGSLLASGSAFAEINLRCRAQLARTSETHTETLPRGRAFDDLEISDQGTASISYTFSLNGNTDLVYRLDIFAKITPSRWKRGIMGFALESKLWDLKNNKVVAIKTETSDNVRTSYLLNQLLDEGNAIVASDTHSFELKAHLLNLDDAQISGLASEGRWLEANQSALSRALVNPYTALFASINCILEN